MKRKTASRIALAVAALAVAFLLGTLAGGQDPATTGSSGEVAAPETWTCSMHPQIRMPEPGQCPICFMDLIPAGSGQADDGGEARMAMSDAAVKLAEIRTAAVTRGFPTMDLRLVGKVDVDETRVRTLAARTGGRLDRLYVDYSGMNVREGDHLVWMYSPELVAAQEELLQALRADRELAESSVHSLRDTAGATVEAARDKLRLLGLTDAQVRQIEESGEVSDHLTIYSPIDGVVLDKLADQGSYVRTGDPIYRLADLSQVWVQIDAYESDLVWLRFGQEVTFTAEAWPGREFTGRISFIDPVLDQRTRTAKVRVNLSNEDLLLKPGMFVRAVVHPKVAAEGRVMASDLAGKWISPMHPEIVKDGPGQCDVCGMDLVPVEQMGYAVTDESAAAPLLIPASAPLITGRRAVVYVQVPDTERPTFEGREVVLGPRAGDAYIVEDGLFEGERVVVNGAFKIDSAMQIEARPSMLHPPAPVAHEPGEAPLDVPAGFRAVLGPLVQAVLDLTTALAADDFDAARARVGEVARALDAVATTDLGAEARERWFGIRDDLVASIAAMDEAKDIEGLRGRLPSVTAATARAIRSFGVELDADVRLFHCPMAFDDAGADWLQSGETTANPYFGARMFRCGSQKEILAGGSR
jgi:Cu(I)/Ag(I) efflux system membrane fusion protein